MVHSLRLVFWACVSLAWSSPALSQENKPAEAKPAASRAAQPKATPAKPAEKPKMQFLGAFDAGHPGVNIYKMFDPTDDVVCYVLMPEVVGRRPTEGDKWIYDGNSIGSISCLKAKITIAPAQPAKK